MDLLQTLNASREDFQTLNSVLNAGIPVTDALIGGVARWFNDVDVRYPIAEMELAETERMALAKTVTEEMLQAVDDAIAKLRSGSDVRSVMSGVAPVLDNLWRELAGVFAATLNTSFRRSANAAIEQLLAAISSVSGDDRETVLENLRQDPEFREKITALGLDPDEL